MSIWTCLKCAARYAVGLPACPQCQSTERSDDPNYTPPEQAAPGAETPAATPSSTKGRPEATAPAPEAADSRTQGGGKP